MPLGSEAAARRAAEAIVSEGRFHQPPVPDPLHGVVEWVGNAVTDPFNAIGRLVVHLGQVLPGGIAGAWAVGAALLVFASWMLISRRARSQLGQVLGEAGAGGRATPFELEREAARAERAGLWDEAVRLRFRAGILLVGERLELQSTETVPNHVIGRRLHSRRFDSLAERFDEVTYGGDVATAGDAQQQREGWPELLRELGGR